MPRLTSHEYARSDPELWRSYLKEKLNAKNFPNKEQTLLSKSVREWGQLVKHNVRQLVRFNPNGMKPTVAHYGTDVWSKEIQTISPLRLHLHLSLNRWVVGAPQMTSQPISSIILFSTVLWDLANSRSVHSLMLSSHLFFFVFFVCIVFFPLPLCLVRWFWPDLMNGRYVRVT